jgi:glutathione S-transferase
MSVTLYYMSGSPYSWRVWLALEHKSIPHDVRTMSYDAGDLKTPEFAALNPRRRVPVLVDDGFALYESAAILDYLEEKWPQPSLLATNLHERAIQRRMIREADQYFATAMEHLVDAILFTPKERWSEERISAAATDLKAELAMWEKLIAGEHLAGPLSAVDLTLYPLVALALRLARRKPDLGAGEWLGPKMRAWAARMEGLPVVQKTWPPHWKS